MQNQTNFAFAIITRVFFFDFSSLHSKRACEIFLLFYVLIFLFFQNMNKRKPILHQIELFISREKKYNISPLKQFEREKNISNQKRNKQKNLPHTAFR